MDFDPINRDFPASRYEIESGSEDEIDAGLDTASSKTQEPFHIVSTQNSQDVSLSQGNQLVVLVGKAGLALLMSLPGSAPVQQYSLRTETEQHASISVIESSPTAKVTIALVAPPPQLHSSRFHEIAQMLMYAARPSSLVVVDSYSSQEQLYSDPHPDDAQVEWAGIGIRYVATRRYLAEHKVDTNMMTPLKSPEAAAGLGAAFLSQAVIRNVPAILALLEDVSFQSYAQLYGSLGAERLSSAASETLGALTGLSASRMGTTEQIPTILDFAASRRTKPAVNLAVLGDGNMYI
ncbi:uncharacterized protein MEPE_04237 [Melanopsichium pennsylvanicum]|uniref:Uncharacterized protein n=2 Tax=Melanopsichium pennsylvanicum TaxID=63383 RepID=A0AAJ5C6G9_9BASI|nr:putative protein [Melanopsichium pennsylvanicum 4]SNX85528.1 uncharacterized protein MEPE_04237 [Melanopsichium pennsylvanicum]